MAAVPVSIPSIHFPPPIVALTERRLAANRRNARRSTGPRTAEGKARVARNPIKHGFFVAQEKWTPTQHRDFAELLDGLREDFQPQDIREDGCVASLAASYLRMAAMLRWENVAALKYHRQREREMEERIAAAETVEAARLKAYRENLRRAGLWRPILPGPREANAIIRYSGCLDRAIRRATSELKGLQSLRNGSASRHLKAQKQTHFDPSARSGPEAAEGPRWPRKWEKLLQALEEQSHFEPSARSAQRLGEGPQSPSNLSNKNEKTNPFGGIADGCHEALRRAPIGTQVSNETEKTNPLNPTLTGNRHERRRAKALARRSAP